MLHRYLDAYIGDYKPDCRALLRFPPGVTLEDAGYDWLSIRRIDSKPTLPQETVKHLCDLGVEIAAHSPEALWEVFWRGTAPLSSIGDFAQDYLGVNDRLGGKRCVSIEEYAMHTYIKDQKDQPLCDILRDYLHQMDDVRLYDDVAFRTRSLPHILRLRVQNIVGELDGLTPISMPCRLHGDQCRLYTPDVADAIYVYVDDERYLGERVGVRRRLLDAAKNDGDPRRVAWVLLAVVLRVLYALPKGAVSWNWRGLASLVAFTVAETCEEHAMLAQALRECGSVREMVRRARGHGRDPSWAVSRALEGLRDG